MSTESSSSGAHRGQVLLEQGRYPEAEQYFRGALAQDPNDPFTLYRLAVCELQQDRAQSSLETIRRAIGLEPEMAEFHAFQSFALLHLRRRKEASAAAAEALRLDPDSDYAFTARAAAFLSENQWGKAEEAARHALDLNPENSVAANQLAHALRAQNRLRESGEQVAYMLSQDPEDADNHATAGWVALQAGRSKDAERHFLESLRLDATNEAAREGLKEAFKARSPIYRSYLAYCFFMQRFTEGKQWLVVIGLIVAVRFARAVLPPPLALLVVVLYFLFVLWVHVARAVGNFQLTFDRFARHALTRAETVEAYAVGGGVVAGLLLFGGGLLLGSPLLLIPGLTLIGAAFPLAYTFTNEARAGRLLFSAVAALVLFAGAANFAVAATGRTFGSWVDAVTGVAALAVIAVTWLCNVRVLSRRG